MKATLIGLVIGIILVAGGYWGVNRHNNGLPFWSIGSDSSTWGTTLNPTICYGTDKAEGSKWPCVPYQYSVNGQMYQGDIKFMNREPSPAVLSELRTRYPVGTKVKIRYDIKSPQASYPND